MAKKRKRTTISKKLKHFHMVYYPSLNQYLAPPDGSPDGYTTWHSPAAAFAAGVKTQLDPDSDLFGRPFEVFKYIPVAVLEPEYHQRRLSEMTNRSSPRRRGA